MSTLCPFKFFHSLHNVRHSFSLLVRGPDHVLFDNRQDNILQLIDLLGAGKNDTGDASEVSSQRSKSHLSPKEEVNESNGDLTDDYNRKVEDEKENKAVNAHFKKENKFMVEKR